MLSKFGITNIIESLNTPVHFFKTINKVEFNTDKGSYFYINKQSYNFIVTYNNLKYQLKFYKNYSSLKSQNDYTTTMLASKMKDSPFSEALWLENEFYFSHNHKKEMYSIAMYEIPSKESFEYFLRSFNKYEDKNCITEQFNSFLNILKWLLNSNYTFEKLSLASFYISGLNRVVINSLDIDLKLSKSPEDATSLIHQVSLLLSSTLQTISSCDNQISSRLSKFLNAEIAQNKSDLIDIINQIIDIDITSYSSYIKNINCFNNPNYKVETFREENRVIVTDLKTDLKGYSTYDGTLVTDCIYENITNYNEGLAVAILNKRAGVIDKDNHTVIDFVWDWIEIEYDYNIFIAIKDDIFVILNRKAKEISNKKFNFVGTFFNGYSIVVNENNKTGVITPDGNYVIEPIYDYIEYCQMKEFKVTINGVIEKINL